MDKMTNKEAHELLFTLDYYDEEKDAIYYYPCDDLHGMFSDHSCNCTIEKFHKYRKQDEIDKKIEKYLEAQSYNKQ